MQFDMARHVRSLGSPTTLFTHRFDLSSNFGYTGSGRIKKLFGKCMPFFRCHSCPQPLGHTDFLFCWQLQERIQQLLCRYFKGYAHIERSSHGG